MHPLLRQLYYPLRPFIPLRFRWLLQRFSAGKIDGLSTDPMWPIPDVQGSFPAVIWPENNKTALVLTHDVDTDFGFRHIQDVAVIENNLGFHGSWNIVPHLYSLNQSVMAHLRDSGMEIGVHDWNHDGHLFSNRAIFHERAARINEAILDWGASGFRAGMMFHHDEWLQELSADYDASYYDTDPYQPLGGGCRAIAPFLLGHLVELPCTMPQDHVLFVAEAKVKIPRVLSQKVSLPGHENVRWMKDYRRHHCRAVLSEDSATTIRGMDLWKMKATWLVEKRGLVLMLTHPDYLCHPDLVNRNLKPGRENLPARAGWLAANDHDIQAVRESGVVAEKWHGSLLEQYAAFLHWFKREFEDQYWHCLPMEVAAWYRKHAG